MTKFKKQEALPCKFQKKFEGSLFYCREISGHKYWWNGKTLSVLSKSILKPGGFLVKKIDKSRLKAGKIKMAEFQKMYVRRLGNHSFFII